MNVELKTHIKPQELEMQLFSPMLDVMINELYSSNSFEHIKLFYEYFQNSSDLFKWMFERPKGINTIVTVKGKTDNICVVIPTVSSTSDFAKRILNEAFKDLTVIFVESGLSNPFFNFSHNCNVGFQETIERFDPEWIIYSNDDMLPVNRTEELLRQLSGNEIYLKDFVFAGYPSRYHSYVSNFIKPNIFNNLLNSFRKYEEKMIKKEEKHLRIEYLPVWNGGSSSFELLSHKILHKSLGKIINIGSFGIFNSKFIKRVKGMVFDETFINGLEDVDFSIRILQEKLDVGFIKFKIDDVVGGSSARGSARFLQLLADYAYFNHKYPLDRVRGIIGQAENVYGFPP